MFDSWGELLVIAVVALVVVGPKELPQLLRTIGRLVGQARKMAGEFQSQFNDAMREADLEDVKKHVDDLRSLNPKSIIANQLSSVTDELAKVDGAVQTQLSPFDVGASHDTGSGFASASAAVAGLEADHRSSASVIDAALQGESVALGAPLDISPAPVEPTSTVAVADTASSFVVADTASNFVVADTAPAVVIADAEPSHDVKKEPLA